MNKYKTRRINGKTRAEHRIIIESSIGRTLTRNEIVHHIDGNKSNNDPSNLKVMARSDHSRMHSTGVICTEKTRKIKSEVQLAYWKDRPSPDDRPVVQLDLSGNEIARFRSARDAQRKTKHFNTHIVQCCNGTRKTHHGFRWTYA